MILEFGVYLLMLGLLICGGVIVIVFVKLMMNIYKDDKPLFIFIIGLLCLLFGCIIMAIISSGCI